MTMEREMMLYHEFNFSFFFADSLGFCYLNDFYTTWIFFFLLLWDVLLTGFAVDIWYLGLLPYFTKDCISWVWGCDQLSQVRSSFTVRGWVASVCKYLQYLKDPNYPKHFNLTDNENCELTYLQMSAAE